MSYEKKPINALKGPMNNDYLEIQNSEGMPGLVDSTIALNFLLNAKSGIKNCATALTEIADPEARKEIHNMLNAQIDLHAQISELMMNKGWFHPYHVAEQFKLDLVSAQAAVQISNMQLFPGNTSRLGTFATPNY
ncbi:spore coat protein [Desulfosporosinus sp. HMP52]|uniref:spore coat protein n=1 Tax=Desulfosporosinus sp. HMP52 TaxID=1487923 RepID=UPI000A45D753|nr:spore coat protein [Desulfosporosinus sp. HMP52]